MSNNQYICDYGCGQESNHQFKNGKWCCSIKINKCPEIRRQNSEKNKGNQHNIGRSPHNKLSKDQWIQKLLINKEKRNSTI